MESGLVCLDIIKELAENREDKESICQAERQYFEKLREKEILFRYPRVFLKIADYWYQQEKTIAPKMIETLLRMYLHWDNNNYFHIFNLEPNDEMEQRKQKKYQNV